MFRSIVWRFIPAILLGLILLLLYTSLTAKKNESVPLVKTFPEFVLTDLRASKAVSLSDLKGDLHIVHVWATWCGACVKEHPEWVKIKAKWPYKLVGIVYRDEKNKVKKLLATKEDPYLYLLNDVSGALGVSLGLMGTPETFIIDKKGAIRYHHYGPVTLSKFEALFIPVIEKIRQENA